MIFGVNTSPLAGRDGQYVTSRNLRDRLERELLGNVSLRVENTDSPEQLKVIGRGELQLSILIEMMRREGFELQVSRPEIVTKEIDGVRSEPVEELVIDIPEDFQGVVIAQVGTRRGIMTKMVNHGSGRVRMEFRIPARGLIGFRSQFLTDTRGHRDHEPPVRRLGAVARADSRRARPGHSSRIAPAWRRPSPSRTCRNAARSSSSPQTEVYEGMIIGENSRHERHGRQRHEGKEADEHAGVHGRRGHPPDSTAALGLEQAIAFINDDELVEVTPKSIRLRKRDPRRQHAAAQGRRRRTCSAWAPGCGLQASRAGHSHGLERQQVACSARSLSQCCACTADRPAVHPLRSPRVQATTNWLGRLPRVRLARRRQRRDLLQLRPA